CFVLSLLDFARLCDLASLREIPGLRGHFVQRRKAAKKNPQSETLLLAYITIPNWSRSVSEYSCSFLSGRSLRTLLSVVMNRISLSEIRPVGVSREQILCCVKCESGEVW